MADPRPTVLFVGAFPDPQRFIVGGMATASRTLLQSQFSSRFSVVPFDGTKRSNRHDRLLRRAIWAVRRFLRFVRKFEATRPDAVLAFVAAGGSVVDKGLMMAYARMRGVPTVLFPRAGAIVAQSRRSRLFRTTASLVFRGAAGVLSQGSDVQEFLVTDLGVRATRTAVVFNWTASEDLLRIASDRQPQDPADDRIGVAFIGWLVRRKGPLEAAVAINRCSSSAVDFHVVGDGPMRELLEQYRDATNGHRLVLHGWLDFAAVRNVLQHCSVFVLPSVDEGMPNALIEAMAAGLACVVYDAGSIGHVLDQKAGVAVVTAGDVDGFATELEYLVQNPLEAFHRGQLASKWAEGHFAVDAAAVAIGEAVEQAILGFRQGD